MNHLHRTLCLTLLCLTQFIALLDFSITMIPLPQIQESLLFTPGGLQWVINAYGVAIAGFLLLGGRAADLFGRKRIFLIGILIFTIASVLGGFAQSPSMLVIARAFQGLGAALFSPAALSILLSIFILEHERNKALGVWAAVAATGFVAGLILGGTITDLLSWRWVLWVNVPIGIAVLIFSYILPIEKPAIKQKTIHLDILGALLISSGVATLIYAFANSEHIGITHPITYGFIILSIILLILFVWVESKVGSPIMPIPIFWHRATGGANLISLLANTALGPTFIVTALYMQSVLFFSPTQAGFGLLPMAIFFTASSAWVGPALITKIGIKPTIFSGLSVFIVGLILLGFSLTDNTIWIMSILPGTILVGIGYGIAFPAWTLAGIDDVDPKDHGIAGGMLTTTQEVGSAVGLAISVAIGIEVLSTGGTVANSFSYAILLSAGIVLLGLFICAVVLPKKPRRNE